MTTPYVTITAREPWPSSTGRELDRRTLLGAGLALTATGLAVPAHAAGAPPAVLPAGARAKLAAQLTPLTGRYQLGISVKDWRTGATWSSRGAWANNLASVTKVLTAVAAIRRSYARGRPLTATERSWVVRALEVSDNNAQNALWAMSGRYDGWDAAARAMGLSSATRSWRGYGWGRCWSTADDQRKLMDALVSSTPALKRADVLWLQSVMLGVSPAQIWGVGAMGKATGRSVRVKDGWVVLSNDGTWRINSIGHVTGQGRNYTLAILSRGWRTMGAGTSVANQVGRSVWTIMGTDRLA